MNENGQLINTEEETAQSLGNFFSSVFVKECIGNTDTDEESGMSRNSVRLAIDENTVMNKLLKLKVDKAQGQMTSTHQSWGTVHRLQRYHWL